MRQERGAGVGLRQDVLHRRGDRHALVAVPAGVLRVHVPLDPHLCGLEVIALADLLPDALSRPAHSLVLVRAPLLVRWRIVRDLLARQMCWDRLAAATVWARLALMGGDDRGALLIGCLRRLDSGEHLGLVEQHLLIGRGARVGETLGGAAVELALQPPHLLLEQPLALEGLVVLNLKLLVSLSKLLEGRLGELQPRRKLGVLIEEWVGARWGRHGMKLYRACRTLQHLTLTPRA